MRNHIAILASVLLLVGGHSTLDPRVSAQSGSTSTVVISQVYGGGGNTNAAYQNDFVELFNRGSVPVPIDGWSLQYASATGTGNLGANSSQLVALAGTLQPGQYYLVRLASGGAVGLPLPAHDASGTINGSASAGKFALVASAVSLGCNGGSSPCSAAQLALIRDLVGYGTGAGGANFFEGSGAAPTLSATNAGFRRENGCQDTNNNSADFVAAPPAPRNSTVTGPSCGGSLGIGGSAQPNPVVAGNALTVRATVSLATVPPSTGVTVTANLLTVGGTANTSLFDDGITPDQTAGDNVYTGQVFVPLGTTPGVKPLSVSAADLQGRSTSANFNVTVEAPPTIYLPHEIQGSGLASTYAGQTVVVEGVVTARRSNGFFLQTVPGSEDLDANTSEGIFVLSGSPVPAAAAIGNVVRVTGPVAEFLGEANGQTRTNISSISNLVSIGTSALPAPVALTAADLTPGGNRTQLEHVEGMRVQVDLTTIAPTDSLSCLSAACESVGLRTSNGVFYAVITGTPRPVREAGIEAGLAVPACAEAPCSIPVFDGNPERLFVDSDALGGAPLNVTSNVSLPGVTAIVDSGFGEWTLLPEDGGIPAVGPNMAPTTVPAAGADEFTVASFNMERFFDTVDTPSIPGGNFPGENDVALTPENFARRLSKASQIIRGYLRSPDVIGVQEVENVETLQAIGDAVNADAGTPGDYVAYLAEGNDVGGIDVGFLVRSSRVTVSSVTQYGLDTTFTNPNNNQQETLNDRPPLVLRGIVNGAPAGRLPAAVTVVVNHLRSLNDVDLARVQAKRLAQAEFLAQLLIDLQAEGTPVISVGDYNAFEVNDGYVDSMGILLGAQAPPSQVARYSTLGLNPAMARAVDVDDYSYVFDGNAQNLDHVLVDPRAATLYRSLAHARVNADFPEVLRNDASRPERLSDHDPAVAYFVFPPDTVAPTITVPGTLTTEATGPAGAFVAFSVTATDNVDPDVTIGCSIAGGTPVTSPYQFAIGATVVSCTATDDAGNSASDSFSVIVQDTTSPVLGPVSVSLSTLWPANHRLVDLQVFASATDAVGAVCAVTGITSSEPDNGLGDGDTAGDAAITGPLSVRLRAERAGSGPGRTYTIAVACSDAAGNTAHATVPVFVPKSQKK